MLLALARVFEGLADCIEYGPVEAIKINTSLCPEAERSYRKIMESMPASTESAAISYIDDGMGEKTDRKNEELCKNRETCLDESEEEMISKAIATKGSW